MRDEVNEHFDQNLRGFLGLVTECCFGFDVKDLYVICKDWYKAGSVHTSVSCHTLQPNPTHLAKMKQHRQGECNLVTYPTNPISLYKRPKSPD